MKTAGLIFIAVAVLALGGGIIARGLLSPTDQASAKSLPDFTLPDVSGQPHAISEWQGKLRVINFWATWCGPCLKEIPEFIELQNHYADKGLQFIGIAIDSPEAVATYLNSININYPMLVGDMPAISIAHELGNHIDAVPFTVIVNQQGQIIHQHAGEFSKEQLLEVIKPLLN
jgi:thiol-disulfide isomerase/thioredoxin